jgi:hypothetical protein
MLNQDVVWWLACIQLWLRSSFLQTKPSSALKLQTSLIFLHRRPYTQNKKSNPVQLGIRRRCRRDCTPCRHPLLFRRAPSAAALPGRGVPPPGARDRAWDPPPRSVAGRYGSSSRSCRGGGAGALVGAERKGRRGRASDGGVDAVLRRSSRRESRGDFSVGQRGVSGAGELRIAGGFFETFCEMNSARLSCEA